ncbi:MerR family transcriptional regulator [Microbacteriaceae bacterium VKM Ac-2854]|nr:MerR family transcriptional regulator [Microbacteriaceae bacterium VKM Ac-2854]
MAFTTALTSVMSGASQRQLAHWRATGILVPETEHDERPYLYSFRDIVALRTYAWLRETHSQPRPDDLASLGGD